jgi:hypothetical protein
METTFLRAASVRFWPYPESSSAKESGYGVVRKTSARSENYRV